MDIKVLASSSAGNCYTVSDGTTSLLLECGLNIKTIKQKLDFDLTPYSACLISHSHLDHAKAWRDVADCGIDLYMTLPTAEALGAAEHFRTMIIYEQKQFKIGSLLIMPFPTEHDCPGSVGFIIYSRNTKDKLIFITDSFYSHFTFSNFTHLMIECNHASEILDENIRSGVIPRSLGLRLMQSHFNINDVKALLNANDLSKLREIWLIHMSQVNSDPERFKREIQAITGVPVYIAE